MDHPYCKFPEPLSGFCGECYAIKRGRRPYKKGLSTVPTPHHSRTVLNPTPPKPGIAAQPPPMNSDIPSPQWADLYPTLWWHLSATRDGSGAWRITSTLLVFYEHGGIKLCLHDRARKLVLFMKVSDMPEGLARLETKLSDGTAEWRHKR